MTKRVMITSVVIFVFLLGFAPSTQAGSVPVRFTEGVAHGFPVIRSVKGERLATGEMIQVARGDVVENRLVFRFKDGSLYEETVVFLQRGTFVMNAYRLVQHGPSFPESIDASIDRETGRYSVRYRADADSAEETVTGQLTLPEDVYSGMLGMLLKNLAPGESTTVQIVVFTPQPRLVKILLAPSAEDQVLIGDQSIPAIRYQIKPQLGLLASLMVVDLAPMQCWIASGAAPAFIRFEGPLYFMGPTWRIEPY